MKMNRVVVSGLALLAFACLFETGCRQRINSLVDDGGGRKPGDFADLAFDVFQSMDGGIELSADEIKGRNTWNLWCGGTEQFWDRMAREGFGLFDLLKTLDSRKRSKRFKELGLINQPGFRQAVSPDRYGLWIDEAVEPEPGNIDPEVYGHPSGVMGFRLFDNPDFTAEAASKWDANKYYNDPDYAVRSDLVRPYKVGVSCGSCHIAFHPTRPPADPDNPKWENLASAIGNQYLREGRVFGSNVKPGGFFWEMFATQPAGTSDTSRIATDHINNPNAINAIFDLNARLSVAEEEKLGSASLVLPDAKPISRVPHVLKDGADSVGVIGATVRVYVNIGMYSQHWLQQHNALIGLKKQKPFDIATAQKNSVYWVATQRKAPDVAKFFMKVKPYRLEDAPGGNAYLTQNEKVMNRGRIVFADNCAKCHSSKRPPAGTASDEAWFRTEVLKADFRDDNFFSDEKRYPVTMLKMNAARACATNGKRGHIWDEFSSESYKVLPSVGDIDVWNPYTGQDEKFNVPGGGTGYYRTPSLISLWSSAPFLHNNALGKFTGDPSVAGRMEAFNDAVEKLLWPEKRLGKGSIWRTTRECYLQVQGAVIPEPLRTLVRPHMDPDGYFRLGPIPQGTPINLLANIDPDTNPKDLIALCLRIKGALYQIKTKSLGPAAARELMKTQVAPLLFKISKCPDLVEDRGHYFGSDLAESDKRALIEYLKTL